jgi:hypothetical protein
LKLALLFNLPRIIILSVGGTLIGIAAFILTEKVMDTILKPWIGNAQVIGYGILGLFILIFGIHIFLTSVETQEDIREEKEDKKKHKKGSAANCAECNTKNPSIKKQCSHHTCNQKPKKFGLIQQKIYKLQQKPNSLFMLWGGILSIACLGEILIAEMPLISGSLGATSGTLFNAAFLGGFSMFLFAWGASMPIIIVAVVSSSMEKYFQTIEKLEKIRTIGAMVMIMVGLVFVFLMLGAIATIFF